MGLEALSRGFKSVTVVEQNKKSAQVIRTNYSTLGLEPNLFVCDSLKFLSTSNESYDVVYIDPPYRPLSETSSFTSYAKTEFGDEQQIQLGHFIEKISEKGAKVVASNSDPHNTDENDNFFDDIYKMFFIDRVAATRMINSKSNGRGTVSELLICNY